MFPYPGLMNHATPESSVLDRLFSVCFSPRMDNVHTDSWNLAYAGTSGIEEARVAFPEAEIYCPMVVRKRFNRRQRRWVETQEQLFPGYAFVRGLHPQRLRRRHSHFIRALVRTDTGKFAVLPDADVRRIRDLEEQCEGVAQSPFDVGATVVLGDHTPMPGYTANVVKLLSRNEVVLEVKNGSLTLKITTDVKNVVERVA